MMTLALPMNLLGHSASKAHYAEIASIGRKRPAETRRVTYSVIKRLLALALASALLLQVFGEKIFARAFGAQWALAG